MAIEGKAGQKNLPRGREGRVDGQRVIHGRKGVNAALLVYEYVPIFIEGVGDEADVSRWRKHLSIKAGRGEQTLGNKWLFAVDSRTKVPPPGGLLLLPSFPEACFRQGREQKAIGLAQGWLIVCQPCTMRISLGPLGGRNADQGW